MVRFVLWIAAIASLVLPSRLAAQTKPIAKPVEYFNAVADKNFYLLTAMERDPEVSSVLRADSALASIFKARTAALADSTTACATDIKCYARALRWNQADADDARQALARLYDTSAPLRGFVERVRASGTYARFNGLAGAEFLTQAWTVVVAGMDHAVDVYGLGAAGRYPAIDAATYDPKVAAGARGVATLVAVMQDDSANFQLFFQPALRFALGLLDYNHRDEAGRFEPMEKGENAAAFAKIASTQWSRYPYSVIVVPGAGNEIPGVRLSGAGKLRVQLAAKRYRDGKAPFLLVSGGFVHPSQTPYAEAIEMKHELMAKYGIPESAILVDPHARHTTTNIRNAARVMYRYGMPFEAKALITTDPGQSASIENPNFAQRCVNEMGYVPLRVLGRMSPFDLEFLPLIESLQSDPTDPLDP